MGHSASLCSLQAAIRDDVSCIEMTPSGTKKIRKIDDSFGPPFLADFPDENWCTKNVAALTATVILQLNLSESERSRSGGEEGDVGLAGDDHTACTGSQASSCSKPSPQAVIFSWWLDQSCRHSRDTLRASYRFGTTESPSAVD